MSASVLKKKCDYQHIAENYSKVNEPQIACGKTFLQLLRVKGGDKVLDMGCGTGELTAFIADLVGEHGQVLGIDPDQERIKVAVQKHSKKNLTFMVGDSSSHFPHYNEEYYDLYYCNFVFQWLTTRERDVYLRTAYKCLRPGGRIALLNIDEYPELLTSVPKLLSDGEIGQNGAPRHEFIKKEVVQSMMKKSGFVVLLGEYTRGDVVFPSLQTFLTWFCVSDYIDESKIVPHKKEEFAKKFVNGDGTVYLESQIYRIIAKKQLGKQC